MTCILQHVALIDSLSHWFAIKQLASDSYVAAAGLPEARDDHAKVMARFAAECRFTMNRVVQKLEVLLGPDTGKKVPYYRKNERASERESQTPSSTY